MTRLISIALVCLLFLSGVRVQAQTAAAYADVVNQMYYAYFGHLPDQVELSNMESALAAANAPTNIAGLAAAYSTNPVVKSLIDSFGTSAESTKLYSPGHPESFVNSIFENVVNRPAAVDGLEFWTNAIINGEVSQGDAMLAILAGLSANDTTAFTDKINAATPFTTSSPTQTTVVSKVKKFAGDHPLITAAVVTTAAAAIAAAIAIPLGVSSYNSTQAANNQRNMANNLAGTTWLQGLLAPKYPPSSMAPAAMNGGYQYH